MLCGITDCEIMQPIYRLNAYKHLKYAYFITSHFKVFVEYTVLLEPVKYRVYILIKYALGTIYEGFFRLNQTMLDRCPNNEAEMECANTSKL